MHHFIHCNDIHSCRSRPFLQIFGGAPLVASASLGFTEIGECYRKREKRRKKKQKQGFYYLGSSNRCMHTYIHIPYIETVLIHTVFIVPLCTAIRFIRCNFLFLLLFGSVYRTNPYL